MMRKRKSFEVILERLKEPRRFIQSLIGPRQVGKTTAQKNLYKSIHRHASRTVLLTVRVTGFRRQPSY